MRDGLDPAQVERAADRLARARLGGPPTPPLPPELTPASEDEGYRVQFALHRRLIAAGFGPVAGHKIGCTTAVMQRFLNIDQPCAGAVFAAGLHHEQTVLRLADHHRLGVECEIAARLGQDLPDRGTAWTRDSVRPAVASLAAAIELVEDRYEDYRALPAPVLIADDFFSAGAVLGAPRALSDTIELTAIRGVLTVDGADRATGTGADIMGHPLAALAWLANRRIALGRPLAAGEFVLLGSVVQTVFFDAPAAVEVTLEGLGQAALRFV